MDKQELLKKVAITAIQSNNLDILRLAFNQGLTIDSNELLKIAVDMGNSKIVEYLMIQLGSKAPDKDKEPVQEKTPVQEKVPDKERPVNTFYKTIFDDPIQAEKDLDNGLVSLAEMTYVQTYYNDCAWTYICSRASILPNGIEMVKKMIKAGIDVNIGDGQKKTALMFAVQYASTDSSEIVVDLLLSHPKIDVNIRDKDGKTALMYAAVKTSNEHVAQMLLKRSDIDVNAIDIRGETALMMAIPLKNKHLIPMLIQHPRINLAYKKDGGLSYLEYIVNIYVIGSHQIKN